jgi:type I restriction enzyme S subunit
MSTGKVSIFLGEVPDANISPNIIIVRLKEVTLAPYVAMTLISDIGQSQIKRFFSGGGKPSLTAPMIANIQIPKPSAGRLQQINKLFDDARAERLRAQGLRSEIESIFDTAFGGYRVKKTLTTVPGIKQLGQRWDAHFHNEGYVLLRSFLASQKKSSKPIKEIAPLKGSTINTLQSKEKYEYVEISSINNLTGVIEEPIIDYPDNLPDGPKTSVAEGDILVSKVRPYLNANVVFHSSNDAIQSVASKNAFAVLDSSQLHLKHYIGAFLRSHLGLIPAAQGPDSPRGIPFGPFM